MQTEQMTSPINGTEYGTILSDELSAFLKKYTNKEDRIEVVKTTDVGFYTIRNLINQTNNLTEQNSKAIVSLIKIAIERCKQISDSAALAELDLIDYIK